MVFEALLLSVRSSCLFPRLSYRGLGKVTSPHLSPSFKIDIVTCITHPHTPLHLGMLKQVRNLQEKRPHLSMLVLIPNKNLEKGYQIICHAFIEDLSSVCRTRTGFYLPGPVFRMQARTPLLMIFALKKLGSRFSTSMSSESTRPTSRVSVVSK